MQTQSLPQTKGRLSSPKRLPAIASLFPGLNSQAPRDSAKLLLGERPTTGLAEFAQHFLEEIRNVQIAATRSTGTLAAR
jgi:hypothetical protein